MREGEELKAPRHASAAATRDGNLPLRDGSLPYLTATCLIPDIYILGGFSRCFSGFFLVNFSLFRPGVARASSLELLKLFYI
jgi:hypothetical protein